MATNIPLTGKFQVTCEYGRKGNWAAGYHTGIDLYSDNRSIYSSCYGKVVRTGYDKSYGNFIVVKNSLDGKYHWFCHLSKIMVKANISVSRTTIIGIMGSTGNSTGVHLHFEIRNISNKYGDTINPADYMGIPNQRGVYDTKDYAIGLYRSHVQDIGWQKYVNEGEISGTTGQSKRIEAIQINSNAIQYRVHLQDIGWTKWYSNNEIAGTTGESRRLEAIEFKSNQKMMAQGHVQDIGWQQEAVGNDITIGTTGKSLRLEAFKLSLN